MNKGTLLKGKEFFEFKLKSKYLESINDSIGLSIRMKYNSQLTVDKDGSDGIRPLVGITSVIDCPPDEHFR